MASAVVAATRWQDIQGENDWKGLLDPVHPELRAAGVRYGEFVEAVYDAIDMDSSDPEYLYYSLFGKADLFSNVGLSNDYRITRYLYTTLAVDGLFGFNKRTSTAWLGYIAVSNDEETKRLGRRDVAVIFRGTKANDEWWTNAHFNQKEFKNLGPKPYPKVVEGFLSMYTASDASKTFGDYSVRQQVFKELESLMEEYGSEDMCVTFVGHSMGAGMAPLAAADFGFNKPSVTKGRTVMVTAFVYGTPKTGDEEFKKRAEQSCKILRIVNTGDVVLLVPPFSIVPPQKYVHVGVEWRVDWSCSPYVKDLGVGMRCHNLELYLHCIAGQKKSPMKIVTSSSSSSLKAKSLQPVHDEVVDESELPISLKDSFKDDPETLQEFLKEQAAIVKASKLLMESPAESRKRARSSSSSSSKLSVSSGSRSSLFELTGRDFALINKSDDLIKDEYNVPKSWWVHAFKGMKKVDGLWLPREKWDQVIGEDNPAFN